MTLRRTSRATLGWAFGICLSIMFISLWGRAVVIDSDTLGESLRPLAGSSTVVDLFADWMADELTDSGADPALVEPAVDHFFESSNVGFVLEEFVVEVVDAASTVDPAGSSIDMRDLVTPAVPEIATGMSRLGFDMPVSTIDEAVRGFDPLVIREPGSAALVGPGSPTAARLGLATLLAALGMSVFGALYVHLSEDRLGAIRALFQRVAVGGFTFAFLLRVGAWVVDPGGGRAPVAEAVAGVAGAKWFAPLQIAVVSAAIASAIYLVRRRFRPQAEIPSEDEQPKRQLARQP